MAAMESIRAVADSLDVLVDRSVGIITTLESIPAETGAPRFHHFEARLSDTGA